jgi:hypothetical protein
LHGIHHFLDDRPGGHWTSWIWSKLHEQYYSHFIRTDGDTVAILWNSKIKNVSRGLDHSSSSKKLALWNGSVLEVASEPRESIHGEKYCVCTGFKARHATVE